MTIKYCYIKTGTCSPNPNNSLMKIIHCLLNNNRLVLVLFLVGSRDAAILFRLWLTHLIDKG